MARKLGQNIAPGQSTLLVRICEGRDTKTGIAPMALQLAVLGTRLIGAIGQMDMQAGYAQMLEPSLSARTNFQNHEEPIELSGAVHANPIDERNAQLLPSDGFRY